MTRDPYELVGNFLLGCALAPFIWFLMIGLQIGLQVISDFIS